MLTSRSSGFTRCMRGFFSCSGNLLHSRACISNRTLDAPGTFRNTFTS
ncbi:Uncharacterised protein [Vibrio cholerae]|nr:Uncharacterised protein [Vibrio cholerae]